MPIKLASSFLIFLLTISSFASEQYSDIEIISSGKNGLSFRLKIDDPQKYLLVRSDEAGDIMVRSVLIAVPIGTEPSLLSAYGAEPSYDFKIPSNLKMTGTGFAE